VVVSLQESTLCLNVLERRDAIQPYRRQPFESKKKSQNPVGYFFILLYLTIDPLFF